MSDDLDLLEPSPPFQQSVTLLPRPLATLKALVRQIKASDEIRDPRIMQRLTDNELQNFWDSDVVVTIIRADTPPVLAELAIELISKAIDQRLRADFFKRQAAREAQEFYASNETYGLF